MADGDHVARPTNVQVRPCEGDESRVRHCMLVPTRHIVMKLMPFHSKPTLNLKKLKNK